MLESFESKVNPVLLLVLGVLDEIESSQGTAPALDDVRPRISRLLGQFDVREPDAELHQYAKRALIYWIDEVLIAANWVHARDWRDGPLEREVYGTRDRAEAFFADADAARGLWRPDSFEVFALCTALGFRGVYREESVEAPSPAGTTRAEILGDLPETLGQWSGSAFAQFCAEPLPAFIPQAPCDSPRRAAPLSGGQHVAWWSVALTVSVLVGLGLVFLAQG